MNIIDQPGNMNTLLDINVQPNNPDVMFQRMGDEAALLHIRTDRIYELNQTAARFWELLTTGQDLVQVQQQMLEEFDVDAAQLAEEMEALIRSMQQEELVSIASVE